MNAIGYVRVSTSEQGEEERFSLPHQREHILQECKARGWQLVNIYEDVESGKSTRRRSGYKQALEAMQTADILIVHELDRFSRNMRDTIIAVDDLGRMGKKFVSIHDGFDTSNDQGELQFHVLAMFAHYFRKQLGRKVHGAMATRAESGLWNTKPPIGYDLVDGRLIPNDEAWIVKKIFQLYLVENMGFRGIAEHFNSTGIKTKQGELWNTFPLKRILSNQAYIGHSVWNKTKRNDTKEVSRPSDEWIITENTHEPIIDENTFYLTHDRLKVKSAMGGREQQSSYLLAGIITCGHCGKPMTGNTNYGRLKKDGKRKIYQRYVCAGYSKQGICHYVFRHKEDIEATILEWVEKIVGTKKQAQKRLGKTDNSREIIHLKKELSELTVKFDRQFKAYEAGVITLDKLKQVQENLKTQEKDIKKRLAGFKQVSKSETERIFLSDYYDTLNKKVWLQQKIKVTVFDNKVDIDVRISL